MPNLTSGVSNNAICGTLYGLFIYNAITAAIALIVLVTFLVAMPSNGGVLTKLTTALISLIVIAVPFLNALFTYMLCDRALLSESK
jgi:hypothetical protein